MRLCLMAVTDLLLSFKTLPQLPSVFRALSITPSSGPPFLPFLRLFLLLLLLLLSCCYFHSADSPLLSEALLTPAVLISFQISG